MVRGSVCSKFYCQGYMLQGGNVRFNAVIAMVAPCVFHFLIETVPAFFRAILWYPIRTACVYGFTALQAVHIRHRTCMCVSRYECLANTNDFADLDSGNVELPIEVDSDFLSVCNIFFAVLFESVWIVQHPLTSKPPIVASGSAEALHCSCGGLLYGLSAELTRGFKHRIEPQAG